MERIDRRTFIALSTAARVMRITPRAAVEATSEPASQDVCALSLSEVSKRIHSKPLTSTDLTKTCLETALRPTIRN
jgi:hypothetical protein